MDAIPSVEHLAWIEKAGFAGLAIFEAAIIAWLLRRENFLVSKIVKITDERIAERSREIEQRREIIDALERLARKSGGG
jgi:hypothetical protein